MKPKPTSSMQRATALGSRSIATPRASSRSAEPDFEVAERLPCLAIAQPAPAATSAAVVETLKVEGPPAVPAVSTRSSRFAWTEAASERFVRASPTSSETVSPLARRAIRKPPVWIGSVRPSMISLRTVEAWSEVRFSPAQTASIARLTTSLGNRARLLLQEVLQQVFAVRGEHRLGVELDALGGQLHMPRAHHDAAEVGGQFELVGEVGVGDQRVIAAG